MLLLLICSHTPLPRIQCKHELTLECVFTQTDCKNISGKNAMFCNL